MARLFHAEYSASEYRAHLGRLLGLFEPFERAVADAVGAHPVYALQKSDALREDLHSMGATQLEIDALERCPSLSPISPAGLHGYTYVVLGSRLGGNIIVKRLRAVLGSTASFRFYGEGGVRSEILWASFCSELAQTETHDIPTICATAVAIFDAYTAWLDQHHEAWIDAGTRQ